MIKLLTIFFLLLSTTVGAETFTVERIIDGDTIKLTSGETVQLIGIDAPEFITTDPDFAVRMDVTEEQAEELQRWDKGVISLSKMGQEAKQFVSDLMDASSAVRLEFDVQKRDKYQRLLAYVYLTVTCAYNDTTSTVVHGRCCIEHVVPHDVEIFLNKEMVRWGYAKPYTVPPNVKYAELFKDLYQEAREQERGLWSNEPFLEPIDCPMDVKECPDGSAVGRVPPNCEFKPCPNEGT